MQKPQSENSNTSAFGSIRIIPFLFLISILSIVSIGFRSGILKKKLREGIIEFSCVPVDTAKTNFLTAPTNMTMEFKNDYYAYVEECGMGFARMKFIADPIKKEFITSLFFFEKKQSVLDSIGIRETNYYLPNYEVEYGNKTKNIAGYQCKNAILEFKNGDPSYEVWFTRKIDIKNPNWANAYYKIDGVLLDYRLKKFGLNLHFIATKVSPSKIDDSYFTIPEEYEIIKNSELEKMMEGFFSDN